MSTYRGVNADLALCLSSVLNVKALGPLMIVKTLLMICLKLYV